MPPSRHPVEPETDSDARLSGDLLWGAGWGLAYAIPLCLFVSVEALAHGSMTFKGYGLTLQQVLLAYVISFVIAGMVVGLFRKQTRTEIGAALVGLVASLPVFLVIFTVMDGPPQSWSTLRWHDYFTICGIMGPAVGLIRWYQNRRWAKIRGENVDSADE
jgi:hypothetical protein